MRPLGEALAARGLRVVAPRLPGHGTTPQALLHVTWRDWQAEAERALRDVGGRRGAFVAGLSVGALLALRLAARHPEAVRALALMAPAVRFRGPRMFLVRQLARTPLLEWTRPWVAKTGTDISDPEARAEAPVLPAFPVARLKDVCTLQALAARDAARVRCPTLVAVAEQDHVVDPEGGRWLACRLPAAPSVRVLSLRQGFHIIPRDTAGPLLAAEVGDFLAQRRHPSCWESSSPAAGA